MTPSRPASVPGLGVGTVLLVALLVSSVVSALTLWWLQRQLDTALWLRPPVMVLDLSAPARSAALADLPARLRAYTQAAERLAAQGVLVLERNAVLATPPALLVNEAEVPRATP
ncbi:hypothetical protein [Thiocystis violacea]|uniref:hypothetical protein n=1 Tax=Thiocystis violacea TaxID=13725 RepID=UPI001902E2F7|nr:hypothetical protein [Thiocystis violacea]MBK1717305.1 hypothetical protein [Thiocystis violacea]